MADKAPIPYRFNRIIDLYAVADNDDLLLVFDNLDEAADTLRGLDDKYRPASVQRFAVDLDQTTLVGAKTSDGDVWWVAREVDRPGTLFQRSIDNRIRECADPEVTQGIVAGLDDILTIDALRAAQLAGGNDEHWRRILMGISTTLGSVRAVASDAGVLPGTHDRLDDLVELVLSGVLVSKGPLPSAPLMADDLARQVKRLLVEYPHGKHSTVLDALVAEIMLRVGQQERTPRHERNNLTVPLILLDLVLVLRHALAGVPETTRRAS